MFPQVQSLYDEDLTGDGYVSNGSRTAAASALGDSYCSLAWGGKLGKASDAAVAAGVLTGGDNGLTDQEKAMAAWARTVATDPNSTTPADVQALRDAGLDDGQIFAITA